MIIARLKAARIIIASFVHLGCVGVGLWTGFAYWDRIVADVIANPFIGVPAIVLIVLFVFHSRFYIFALYQLVFLSGRAIWATKTAIIFLSPYYMRIPRKGVIGTEIDLESRLWRTDEFVTVIHESGRRWRIPTKGIRDPGDTILNSLNQALKLD